MSIRRSLFLGSLLLMVAGCSAEVEVYPRAQATTVALVGTTCELTHGGSATETVIEHPESCGEGVCMGLHGATPICSCRCSGPEGGLPLCSCPNSFHCQDDVILAVSAGDAYAGGYCVAD